MNYPLIKKWLTGVQVWSKPLKDEQYVVLASELEAKLAEGFEVYGNKSEFFDTVRTPTIDKYIALAIGKQPIKKKTREEAAFELLQEISQMSPITAANEHYANKAKKILEMK